MKERMLDKNNVTLELEKMTKESIEKYQISRKELSKKKSLQENGITLIALVVTIIILLILAGVTLNIALSDNGLFSKTKEAAEKYEQAQSDEEEMIRQIATQMNSEYVGAAITGYTPEPTDSYKSGYTIKADKSGLTKNKNSDGAVMEGVNSSNFEQTFNVDTTIKWRIWDFDGNILRIIADPTENKLALEGAIGYNNGVYLMNDICRKLYGQYEENGDMKEGISVLNLKRTDIQKVSTYDYTKYKHQIEGWEEVTDNSTTGEIIQFGDTKPYDNAKYPAMWEKNDQDWDYKATGKDKECTTLEKFGDNEVKMESSMIESTSSTEFKQSYYAHYYNQSEFINEKFFDLIFKKSDKTGVGEYWIGSRSVCLHSDNCTFILDRVQLISKLPVVYGRSVYNSLRKRNNYRLCITTDSVY